MSPCGCFYELGVLFVSVLKTRALLFGIYTKAPESWKLPCMGSAWIFGSTLARDTAIKNVLVIKQGMSSLFAVILAL